MELPDDLLAKLKNGGQDAGEALRLAAAFSLCSRGELSTSQAARLAGMTYAEFLEAAAEATRGFTLGRQRLANNSAGKGGVS
jgi:predicted HTH domain antitoxin